MCKIRYVWGDYINDRQRELYAVKGIMRCAIYTAYIGKPEDNVIRAYQYQQGHRYGRQKISCHLPHE